MTAELDAAWLAFADDIHQVADEADTEGFVADFGYAFIRHRSRIEAAIRADCETRLCWVWRDVTATARRLVKAEDALADAHAAWPIHIGTYDQHLRVQHAAETEVVTAKAALRAALAADPDEETEGGKG